MTELEKWENSYKERNLIKDFLNFASEKYYSRLTTEINSPPYYLKIEHVPVDEDEILDDYFQIDQQKLDEERRALLEKARNMERQNDRT